MGKGFFRAAAATLATAVALAGCHRTTDEARVREQLGALEAAVEARDPGELRDLLSDDFVGNDGADREATVRMAQLGFLRYADVGVVMGPADVDVREGHARVRGTAALTGGAGRLPDTGRLYEVRMVWREEDGEWRLVSLEWDAR